VAEIDAALGRHASVALDHGVLDLEGASHGVDHGAELDERAVARALDDATVVNGDGGIDQIAPKRSEASKDTVLVGAGEPAISDDFSGQNRSKFPVVPLRFAVADKSLSEPSPSVAVAP
jgi:hypothetical protein